MATPTQTSLRLPPAAQLQRFARLYGRSLGGTASRPGDAARGPVRAGPGAEFFEYRDYQPGDDARRIDWRKSQLVGTGQVRSLHQHYQTNWYLCLDNSASMHLPGQQKFERAAQLTAALGYLLLDAGARVSLLQYGRGLGATLKPGRGHQQYLNLCRQLLAAAAGKGDAASQLDACSAPIAGTHCGVIVISDLLGLKAGFEQLDSLWRRDRSVHVLQLNAAAETALGRTGPAQLRDVETGHVRELEDPERAEQTARGKLEQLQLNLQHHCRLRGIHLSQLNTAMDWQTCLSRHLASTGTAP